MDGFPDPTTLILVLGGLAIVPFLVVMATSFAKLVIVFSLIRNALGIQQIPPNMALNGLALILTIYIMMPVLTASYDIIAQQGVDLDDPQGIMQSIQAGSQPYRAFLFKNSSDRDREFFMTAAYDLWGEEHTKNMKEDDLLILLPAFTVSELTTAFEIGFLIYLPFIVIDLIISNILLAMGMMMVSPMTISLPFKLLLFVFLDGWTYLIQGLVLSYK
ncbi:MAG: type III secretion system export apparatus subunit SctR [Chromatiales bacterium]|nr:type III secretion system export apparatus subunit SctR [Chromatiales bacterium]